MLDVVYLIFNEGYAATAGVSLVRPPLCGEAQRLGRILAGLMPEQPEVLGLLALMEIQASRLAARAGPDGQFVPHAAVGFGVSRRDTAHHQQHFTQHHFSH